MAGRRIRVMYHIRSNPCAAIEVPSPTGTRLEQVGSIRIEISVRKMLLTLEAFTEHRINNKEVSEEEFWRVKETVDQLLDKCELANESSRVFSPCPRIYEAQYLCPKEVVDELRGIAKQY